METEIWCDLCGETINKEESYGYNPSEHYCKDCWEWILKNEGEEE